MSQLPPTHQIMDRYWCYTPATRDNDSHQPEVGTLFSFSNSSLCGPLWIAWRALGTEGSLQDTHSQSCVSSLCSCMQQWCVMCATSAAHPASVHLQLLVRNVLFFLVPSLNQHNLPKQSQSAQFQWQAPVFCLIDVLASFYCFLPLALLLFCSTFAVVSLPLCSF